MSQNQNYFNSVMVERPKLNYFDLSHTHKTTCDMGQLVPVLCMEVVPSDHVKLGADLLIKFQPLLAPVYQTMDAYIHYFFVPNRILWPNWNEFITGSIDGEVSEVPPATPFITCTAAKYAIDSFVWDRFGLPEPTGEREFSVDALPFAAYQRIWFEYYRDQNLQKVSTNPKFELVDGVNAYESYTELRYRAWRHDYFTSVLPFAQKGDPVTLPLGVPVDIPVYRYMPDAVPVDETGVATTVTPSSASFLWGNSIDPVGNRSVTIVEKSTDDAVGPVGGLFAPTSRLATEAVNINELRTAFRIQEWLERDARGGTRPDEMIYNHFGVKPQDARLQRPEYISGVCVPVIISETLNTAGGELPQSNRSGNAMAVSVGGTGSYTVTEFGYIIGILSIIPRASYHQGIRRQWSRKERTDYLFPTFVNLGEQEIKNKEIYADQDNAEGTFGYGARYIEYRTIPDYTTGDFNKSLQFWTLTRSFPSAPGLNEDFILMKPEDSKRIFAVEESEENTLLVMIDHRVNAYRPLPKYGKPGI